MRITNRVMNNNLLLNLNRGMKRLDRINNQLGSKKQINLPSDDPVKAGVILRTSSSIRETEQYLRNIDSAASWLDASDIVTKDVIAVIHRAKELAVNGASSHLDNTARKALADEIKQLHGNILQLANSTHGGRYLFAGQHTTKSTPFELEDPDAEGVSRVLFLGQVLDPNGAPILQSGEKDVKFEIAVGVTMSVNMDGEKLFGPIFETLKVLYDELSSGADLDSKVLGDLDKTLDGVLQQVSELGGKENRIELAKERLLDLQLNLTKVLSQEQDLDYAEAIMELKMEEFAYRTALSVGARIIQPSLVDFLR
jgi:flagellar hook-associated protein 3 FlgL